jgi:photosystem II stability/assembly factor-like uncharacterized protein
MKRTNRSARHPGAGRRAGSSRRMLGLLVPALVALPATASANGRFPAAGLIAVDPVDPTRLLVRTTYGLLSTRDSGGEWSWICEGAMGFSTNEDPMVGILSDGTLIAGMFRGLVRSTDGGCGWGFEGGGLDKRYVVDLSVDRADPSRAVLVLSDQLDTGKYLTQLWETGDDGRTWAQAGVALPDDFSALTVDAAPSDPSRVYVSGRFGAENAGAVARSPDRGLTWERLEVPGSGAQRLPYLSAIDPLDPDTLYVRLDGDAGALLVSRDGGESFTPVFQAQGQLLGFALSPDGSTVAIGGRADGLWRAPSSTFDFEKVSDVGVQCLTWMGAGLFACGDEATDGFTGALSLDEGESFTPILHLDTLCGPLACAPETEVGSLCEALWPGMKRYLEPKPCGGEGGGAAAASSGAGAEGATAGAPSDGGCGCRLDAGDGALGGRAAALLVACAAGLSRVVRRAGRRSGR